MEKGGDHPRTREAKRSLSPVGSGSEVIAKHRQAALRFGFGRLILQNIPVLGEAAVLDPDNVRGDPGNRPAISCETSMDNDVVVLRDDELMFVTQQIECAADQFV